MTKLKVLSDLADLVYTEELIPGDNDEFMAVLSELRMMTIKELEEEIIRDITDPGMRHYGPEYESWHDFLYDYKDKSDYAEVLKTQFTQQRLESLWKNSHTSGKLTGEEIRRRLMEQIGRMKFQEVSARFCGPSNAEATAREMEQTRARIMGLYNAL